MTKRTAMWILTLVGVTVSGCSGDDNTGAGGAGGTSGSGGSSGSGGTVRDAAPDVRADASGGADAGGDARADVSQDAPGDVVQEGPRNDGSPAEGGDGGLTPLQARGRYLVNNVIACPDCHTPQGPTGPDLTHYMAGNPDFVVLPNGDHLGSRNLTNDATGLRNRTDDEIKAMFKDGLRPTATGMEALNPVMPYYVFHNMTEADANAIVAYLRTIPGVNNEIPRRGVTFDVPGPANYLVPADIPMPVGAPDAAQESALRGRYLAAESGLCIECHTQHQMAADVLVPGTYFQGGEDFSAFFATTLMIHPVSKNLTSDPTTGLGNWTADDIVRVLHQGVAKDGTGICPPMPAGPMGAYGGLTDGDALDIANYIKALPPVVHNVPDMCVFPPLPPGDGGTAEGGEAGPTGDAAPTGDSATSADGASTGDGGGD